MHEQIKINMGDDPVRFTRDGRIFVMDAIRMIIPEEELNAFWDRLTEDHPDIISDTHGLWENSKEIKLK